MHLVSYAYCTKLVATFFSILYVLGVLNYRAIFNLCKIEKYMSKVLIPFITTKMLYGFFSSHSGIFKDSNVSCSKTGKQIQKYNFSLFNKMCYRIYYSVFLSIHLRLIVLSFLVTRLYKTNM